MIFHYLQLLVTLLTHETDLAYSWSIAGQKWHGENVTISPTQVGQQDIKLAVTNEYGVSTSRSITITVNNDQPDLQRISSQQETISVTAGDSRRFVVRVEDQDASTKTVAFSVDGQRVSRQEVSESGVKVSFTNRFEIPDSHTVEVTVVDGQGESDSRLLGMSQLQVGLQKSITGVQNRLPSRTSRPVKQLSLLLRLRTLTVNRSPTSG